jgi:hypothetical protein
MLPLNPRPEHYMFLLAVSKDNHAGSLISGARLFKGAPSTYTKSNAQGKSTETPHPQDALSSEDDLRPHTQQNCSSERQRSSPRLWLVFAKREVLYCAI